MIAMQPGDYVEQGDRILFGDGHRVNVTAGVCSCGSSECERIKRAQLLFLAGDLMDDHEEFVVDELIKRKCTVDEFLDEVLGANFRTDAWRDMEDAIERALESRHLDRCERCRKWLEWSEMSEDVPGVCLDCVR